MFRPGLVMDFRLSALFLVNRFACITICANIKQSVSNVISNSFYSNGRAKDMKNIKKSVLFIIPAIALMYVQLMAASATMDKIKSSGSVTMGVREPSIPMSYTIGDSRFDGYHVEICRMILADMKDKLGMSTLRINY